MKLLSMNSDQKLEVLGILGTDAQNNRVAIARLRSTVLHGDHTQSAALCLPE